MFGFFYDWFPMKFVFTYNMPCLQILRELLSIATSPNLFKLKRGILPLLIKYVS